MRVIASLAAVVVLGGCVPTVDAEGYRSGGAAKDDTGAVDSGSADTGTADSGDTDTGSTDTGSTDTGSGGTDPSPDRYAEGGWTIGACADSVRATGNRVGQVASDFALTDQFGETVHLHDFCDRAVWLVFAAFW